MIKSSRLQIFGKEISEKHTPRGLRIRRLTNLASETAVFQPIAGYLYDLSATYAGGCSQRSSEKSK